MTPLKSPPLPSLKNCELKEPPRICPRQKAVRNIRRNQPKYPRPCHQLGKRKRKLRNQRKSRWMYLTPAPTGGGGTALNEKLKSFGKNSKRGYLLRNLILRNPLIFLPNLLKNLPSPNPRIHLPPPRTSSAHPFAISAPVQRLGRNQKRQNQGLTRPRRRDECLRNWSERSCVWLERWKTFSSEKH